MLLLSFRSSILLTPLHFLPISHQKNHMKKFLTLTFLFVTLASQINAQTVDQFNTWYMVFGNHKLSDKLGLHTEYQFRRHGFISDWQQSLARIGLDVKLKDNFMFTAGYGWIVSFPYGEQPIKVKATEHRIWQQGILNQKVSSIQVQHRYRLEQRFLENVDLDSAGNKISDGYRFRQRFRYRVLLTLPLVKNPVSDNYFFLSFYEELFLGFGSGIASNVLDQNRLYLALGYKIDNTSNVQLGYLYHRVFKSDGISRENNNTFQLAFTKNLDFSNSEN